jgi:hypothetical protein
VPTQLYSPPSSIALGRCRTHTTVWLSMASASEGLRCAAAGGQWVWWTRMGTGGGAGRGASLHARACGTRAQGARYTHNESGVGAGSFFHACVCGTCATGGHCAITRGGGGVCPLPHTSACGPRRTGPHLIPLLVHALLLMHLALSVPLALLSLICGYRFRTGQGEGT